MKPEIQGAILITIAIASILTLYYGVIKKGMSDADKNNINNIEVIFTEVKYK